MKASVKLRREDPAAPPLLRAKLPVSVLGLPFVAAAYAGAPRDLSFRLRTACLAGPSLHLSCHPHHQQGRPFSLTLRSGVGLWGSPSHSPLLFSAHLPLGAAGAGLSFSIQVSISLGDFSLKGATAVSSPRDPNFAAPKENGDRIHGPLQWTEVPAARGYAAEVRTPGTAVTVRTTLPVARRAAVSLRWAVRLPRAAGGGGEPAGKGLPFLAVDKISVESLEQEGSGGEEKGVVGVVTVEEGDEEALKGMLFWMRREVEEMRREQGSMRESLVELRRAAPASATARGSRRQPSSAV